jgi:hypothetical protein
VGGGSLAEATTNLLQVGRTGSTLVGRSLTPTLRRRVVEVEARQVSCDVRGCVRVRLRHVPGDQRHHVVGFALDVHAEEERGFGAAPLGPDVVRSHRLQQLHEVLGPPPVV